MVKLRHEQRSLWEDLFAAEVADLWEPWMRVVDELSEDDELLDSVFEAQGQHDPHSRTRGRKQTPAEVASLPTKNALLKNTESRENNHVFGQSRWPVLK